MFVNCNDHHDNTSIMIYQPSNCLCITRAFAIIPIILTGIIWHIIADCVNEGIPLGFMTVMALYRRFSSEHSSHGEEQSAISSATSK